MSEGEGGPLGRREVAYRLFASEFNDADLEYSDAEEERAPNYVVTPVGTRVNRIFVVGVLTEVEPVSDDVLRARVVDPTGAFVVYAGQYQPEAVAFLETADVPSFVAVTGKARTFQPEGSDRVFTSIRPEAITSVDGPTRDRWTVQAASHTLARIATMADALDRGLEGHELTSALLANGIEPGLADGVAVALDHYGTDRAYLAALRTQALGAVEVVIGDRDGAPDLDVDPDQIEAVEVDLSSAPAVAGTITQPLTALEGADASAPDATTTEPTKPTPDDQPPSPAPEAAATAADAEPEAAAEVEPAVDDIDEGGSVGSDDLDPEAEYEMDESERAAIEEEFGTEFSTGGEVAEPGEAGIDTETEPPATDSVEPPADDRPDQVEPVGTTDEVPDVDLEDAVVDAMAEIDDGDGADREAVVASVSEETGADAEAIEAAIDEALMGGRCYEPADDRLKAI